MHFATQRPLQRHQQVVNVMSSSSEGDPSTQEMETDQDKRQAASEKGNNDQIRYYFKILSFPKTLQVILVVMYGQGSQKGALLCGSTSGHTKMNMTMKGNRGEFYIKINLNN